MRNAIVLGAAFLSALAVGIVQPVEARAQSNTITLRVCNNTSQTAQVAASYQPLGSGTFSNVGWFNVTPGQCRDLAQTTNAYMYGYAEVEGSDTDVCRATTRFAWSIPVPMNSGTTARPIVKAGKRRAVS